MFKIKYSQIDGCDSGSSGKTFKTNVSAIMISVKVCAVI